MKTYDLALVEEADALHAHEASCPVARQAATDGKPVMTLLGCSGGFDRTLQKMPEVVPHTCLVNAGIVRSAAG